MSASALVLDPGGLDHRDAGAMDAAHARLEREDAARRRWLNVAIRIGGHCHACGRDLQDRSLLAHPGVCGRCLERGRAQPIRLDLELVR